LKMEPPRFWRIFQSIIGILNKLFNEREAFFVVLQQSLDRFNVFTGMCFWGCHI
jgi:hypothetical protein